MAKKFRFTLQSVLGHREHLQEQAQIALARCLAVQAKLENERKILEEELAEQERMRPSKGSGELIMRSIAYIGSVKMALQVNAKQVEDALKEVEKARLALVGKNRDVRALEILREHQMEDFRKESNAKETKLLDDFGTMQFIRSTGSA